MLRVVTRSVVPRSDLERFLRPRRRLIVERPAGAARFEATLGPVRDYVRGVQVEDAGSGSVAVTETIEARLAIPYLGFLFARAFRRELARGDRPGGGQPWWAPPEPVDARAASALVVLAMAAAIGGYLTGILTATVAFAAREFGADAGAQGVSGVVVRFAGALALVGAAGAADRLGRRRVVLGAAAVALTVTALGALSPSLPWLTAGQALARSLGVALLIIVSIVAAEEVSAGSRAYAVSILGMAAAAGSGFGIFLLPLADVAVPGWRLVYAVAILGFPLLALVRRHLPESRRFEAPHPETTLGGHGARFWLLAASAFLANLLTAPASFFLGRYLSVERGLSATGISVLTLVTGTPGAVGVVVGGRLADTRGRRPVGAVAVAFGAVATVLVYLSSGGWLWLWSALGALIGAAALPALGVYGPELFPTSLRGRAGGFLALAGLAGSAAGLLVVGFVGGALGTFAPAIAPLALGPLALAILVIVAYPETAHRKLEDLNPEDRR